jgi:2-oxoglutarate ferredoxin oxidoreductase subunit alpha
VFVLADAAVGHMRETVVIPAADQIPRLDRRLPPPGADPEALRGFLAEEVAPMPVFGRGYQAHVTGSCHDAHGMRNVVDAPALDTFVRVLCDKVLRQTASLCRLETEQSADAEVLLVGYGLVGRAARAIAMEARAAGLRVGAVRPVTVWPFPAEQLAAACAAARRVIVMENNLGQMLPYFAAALGPERVEGLPPATLGTLHRPAQVLARVRQVLR